MKTRIITGTLMTIVLALFFFAGEHFMLMQIGLSILAILGMGELLSITKQKESYVTDEILTVCAYSVVALMPWAPFFWYVRASILVLCVVLMLRFILKQ